MAGESDILGYLVCETVGGGKGFYRAKIGNQLKGNLSRHGGKGVIENKNFQREAVVGEGGDRAVMKGSRVTVAIGNDPAGVNTVRMGKFIGNG